MTDPVLPFTGERFTPECEREIAYEHWHRYAFALTLAPDRRVLDAACGEGYGSAMLAEHAASVVGVDIDAASVAHACSRYASHKNLRFDVADAAALVHLPNASFDLIVSFETLEHLEAQDALVAGFARLLAPGGVLLISTPDRETYNQDAAPNPHHVRELDCSEFQALLGRHFAHRRLYGQKLLFQSVLWRTERLTSAQVLTKTAGGHESGLGYPPTYYLAVCAHSAKAMPALPALSLYGDAEESVYADYRGEVKRNRAAANHIAHLEREMAKLRATRGPERRRGVIGVVVVCHNNAETIARCLKALRADPAVSRVVVIDNGSGDGTVDIVDAVMESDKRVRLFRNPDNPGFASACNQGASAMAEAWLAFVNPDVYVEPATLSRLLALTGERPGIGALGAELVNAKGVPDPNSRRGEWSLLHALLTGGRRSEFYLPVEPDPLQPVAAISGALMMIPSGLFASLGGFDTGFRLHAEDLDLCRRVRASGHEVLVANKVRAIHVGGHSSRARPIWVEWQKHRGLWRYFHKYEARETPAWLRPLLWLGLWGHFVAMVPRLWWRSRR